MFGFDAVPAGFLCVVACGFLLLVICVVCSLVFDLICVDFGLCLFLVLFWFVWFVGR